jgi:hypothetical protein
VIGDSSNNASSRWREEIEEVQKDKREQRTNGRKGEGGANLRVIIQKFVGRDGLLQL